jgi:hypothetical protein
MKDRRKVLFVFESGLNFVSLYRITNPGYYAEIWHMNLNEVTGWTVGESIIIHPTTRILSSLYL